MDTVHSRHLFSTVRAAARWRAGVGRVAAIAALALLLAPGATRAEASGVNTWAPTGSMHTARTGHTATLLPGGQVLLVGGCPYQFSCGGPETVELYDPASGAFIPTGALLTAPARTSHTATLLQGGQVLVAGGCDDTFCNADAELYDPTTHAFSPTTPLPAVRGGHTATLLPGGTVLVAGGQDNVGDLYNSALLYDPTTATWVPTGSMGSARRLAEAVLLHDGRVLVVGGDNFGLPVASAEVYDPASQTWVPTGPMRAAHGAGLTATLLASGKILVAGGQDTSGTAMAEAELYDPATNSWSDTGAMTLGRESFTATLLPNGTVLAAGSFDSSSSAELYNPTIGIWTPTGAMNDARTGHTATLLPSGQVLVAGGCCDQVTNTSLASAELYTPGPSPLASLSASDLTFAPGPSGTTSPPQTVVLSNTGTLPLHVTSVTIGSGTPAPFTETDTCANRPIVPGASCVITVRYTPPFYGYYNSTLTVADDAPTGAQTVSLNGTTLRPLNWAPTAPYGGPSTGHTATLLPTGHVLVVGGGATATRLYDPATNSWAPGGSLRVARAGQTATLLPTGHVLVAGGGTNTAELYDPATNAWTLTAPMGVTRTGATATLLPTGHVLVAGGGTTTAELYTPSSGAWSPAASMGVARIGQVAALLRNGKALVVGGNGTTAEVYDFRTNIWTPTGPMHAARANPMAVVLPSGKALVAGGAGPGFSNYHASTEIYDPLTNSWTVAAPMHTGRASGAGLLLRGGQVLVTGGLNVCDSEFGFCFDTPTAELYDPQTNRWTFTGSMAAARAAHTATLLPNGRVLVVGGNDPQIPAPDAEVYTRPATFLTRSFGPAGTLNAVSGVGFAAGETIRAYWGAPGALLLGGATATGQGGFSGLGFAVPGTPPGIYAVTCVGQTSGNIAASLFIVTGP